MARQILPEKGFSDKTVHYSCLLWIAFRALGRGELTTEAQRHGGERDAPQAGRSSPLRASVPAWFNSSGPKRGGPVLSSWSGRLLIKLKLVFQPKFVSHLHDLLLEFGSHRHSLALALQPRQVFFLAAGVDALGAGDAL